MHARWVLTFVVLTNLLTAAILVGWHRWDETHSFDIAKWRANSRVADCDDDYRLTMVRTLRRTTSRSG